jgi:hypothetical protein
MVLGEHPPHAPMYSFFLPRSGSWSVERAPFDRVGLLKWPVIARELIFVEVIPRCLKNYVLVVQNEGLFPACICVPAGVRIGIVAARRLREPRHVSLEVHRHVTNSMHFSNRQVRIPV